MTWAEAHAAKSKCCSVGELPVAASDGEQVLALARDWPRGRKYEGELEAIIAGCL